MAAAADATTAMTIDFLRRCLPSEASLPLAYHRARCFHASPPRRWWDSAPHGAAPAPLLRRLARANGDILAAEHLPAFGRF